jgi:hypothetical protein
MQTYIFPDFEKSGVVELRVFAGEYCHVMRGLDDVHQNDDFIPVVLLVRHERASDEFLAWLHDEIHDGNAFEIHAVAIPKEAMQ